LYNNVARSIMMGKGDAANEDDLSTGEVALCGNDEIVALLTLA